jgi:glycosyltransferase involved in cell wall biosynthesis
MRYKICGLETHSKGGTNTSAVDWWRVVNPLSHLNPEKFDVTIKKKVVDEKDIIGSWRKLGKNFDLLFSSYIDTPKPYAYLRAVMEKSGLKHIMDLDDNLYDIDEFNPVSLYYKQDPHKKDIQKVIVNDCETLTVTTNFLKKLAIEYGRTQPTYVLPNYIDLETYKFDFSTKKTDKKVKIVYFGSSTHYTDIIKSGIIEAAKMLIEKYGKMVKFVFIGMIPDPIKEALPTGRCDYIEGKTDFYEWVELWKEKMGYMDIAIAPLNHSDFNYGKSEIKFYESAACKVPFVGSNTPNYQRVVRNGVNGFVVRNEPIEWFNHLSALIDNPELRTEFGEQAYKDVQTKTIQKHIGEYEEIIEGVLDA